MAREARAACLVLNGPNLGRLGSREPEVYGATSLRRPGRRAATPGPRLGLDVEVRQTDDEAELVGWLHEAADDATPVVLNPAAFTHYCYALRDACAQLHRAAGRGAHLQPARPRGVPAHSVMVPWPRARSPASATGSYLLALRAIAGQP